MKYLMVMRKPIIFSVSIYYYEIQSHHWLKVEDIIPKSNIGIVSSTLALAFSFLKRVYNLF